MSNELTPSKYQIARKTASNPGKITGKLKEALDLIVNEGMTYQQAAAAVGMHVRPMRKALEKPWVLQYLRNAKHVLRESLAAANPRRLAQIRDSDKNLAASVRAALALEQNELWQHQDDVTRAPGLVIQIISSERPTIDVTPRKDVGGLVGTTSDDSDD